MSDADRWWYVFGGYVPDAAVDDEGDTDDAWATVMVCGSSVPPDEADLSPFTYDTPWGPIEVEHVGTFDHEPSEEERDALAPADYRREPADA